MLKRFMCVLVACVFAVSALADPAETIELDKAPPAVQAAVKKAVGEGKLEKLKKEVEDGKTVYEAEYEVDHLDGKVKVSESGQVLEEEKELLEKDVPPVIMQAVKAKYADAKFNDASVEKKGGATTYEICIHVGKVERELKLDAEGKILKDEVDEEDEKKEDKKDDGQMGDRSKELEALFKC